MTGTDHDGDSRVRHLRPADPYGDVPSFAEVAGDPGTDGSSALQANIQPPGGWNAEERAELERVSTVSTEHDEERPDRFPRLSWRDAFAIDFSRIDWLLGRFMERGQQVSIVGSGKAGKSLFLENWIWCGITGRPFLGDQHRDPISVLYFDRENSLRDIVSRMKSLGATDEDLDVLDERFDYRMFPRFSAALDASATAARELLSIVDETKPDVVVFDTVSRFISGNENDSSTWLAFYGYVHAPLKARGIAGVRLDHTGKDQERGSRGSSAKSQDVDHVWELTLVGETKTLDRKTNVETIVTNLRMNRTFTRTGLGEDTFLITRRGLRRKGGIWLTGGTRHELTEGAAEARLIEGTPAWIVDQLDQAGVPVNWGVPKVMTKCTELGIRARKEKFEEAVRIRKARGRDLPRNLPRGPDDETPPMFGGDE